MREIKFRFWSSNYNKYLEDMQYPNGHSMLWLFASDGTPYHIETGFDGLEAIPLREKIGEIVVEQFTGLHDNNGKEWYDGDLVQVHKDAPIHVTFWCDNEMGWKIKLANGKSGWFNINAPLFTIIGNIHQNPELLK